MHHVHANEQGDAQTAFLHGGLLQLTDAVGACLIEDGTQFALLHQAHQRTILEFARGGRGAWQQIQLSQFLLYGHLGHQLADKFLTLVFCLDSRSCHQHQC